MIEWHHSLARRLCGAGGHTVHTYSTQEGMSQRLIRWRGLMIAMCASARPIFYSQHRTVTHLDISSYSKHSADNPHRELKLRLVLLAASLPDSLSLTHTCTSQQSRPPPSSTQARHVVLETPSFDERLGHAGRV